MRLWNAPGLTEAGLPGDHRALRNDLDVALQHLPQRLPSPPPVARPLERAVQTLGVLPADAGHEAEIEVQVDLPGVTLDQLRAERRAIDWKAGPQGLDDGKRRYGAVHAVLERQACNGFRGGHSPAESDYLRAMALVLSA